MIGTVWLSALMHTSQTASFSSDVYLRSLRKADNVRERFLRNLSYAVQLVLYFISRLVPGQEVCILTYHSVDVNDSFYTVSPHEFARQIEYLRKNYTILSLGEIVDFAEGKRDLPRKSVAITFDDGYYDNYLRAYSYLRKNGLPATIFVCTSRVGGKILLDKIPLKALGWGEIAEMSRNNIAIGAHTVNHPDLSILSTDRAKQEIQGAKTAIEERIGKKVDYFSYPSDRYNKQVISLVRSLGYEGAVGGEGLVRRGSQIYLLNRIQVDRSIPFFMFKVRLSRAISWYKKISEFTRLWSLRSASARPEVMASR